MTRCIATTQEMSALSQSIRSTGKTIACVPTMGALHEGHLTLMTEGKKRADFVVVSIFVNPTQFNDAKDFEAYPRTFEDDLKKCEQSGVDVVFAPSVDEIYPQEDPFPLIPVPTVGQGLEGISRPGHFSGVVNVVYRLFRIIHPDCALFGWKDYQQVRVLQEMLKEQKMNVSIVPIPTIRTKEGLALSSRNARLSPEGKQKALILSRALDRAQKLFVFGERSSKKIEECVRSELRDPSVKIDRVDVVDALSLEPVPLLQKSTLVAIAVFVEGVRLIDHCVLGE